ncbi:inorganic phosphate transporter [Aureisphaera galaxeae]|uniref:inorganic phosphate transporter n=1 Tax=Aureisphaera galaxeae TaxID=1538023 RepID=UPI002350CD80|nr:inorganic phosphate transporter [Aureisphaera galaxeae]MDC8005950.1 inorganic phosphate transporter [Aureisphaera galaxeae]
MDNIYVIMLIALAVLAIADLVVGVSNDAVNFLNSAIGSKAISFRTIMIVASVGIAFGALSSSGMMEVARKGIFVPGQFYFDEIMIIFMAVMITDILLLDFFNTLGLPTSTTVSIVFELLGAAVCVSLIKISGNGDTILQLGEYINSEKATEIILGILLSVVVAFTIGALVQFVSRYLLTFHFEKKPSWMAAVFGGLAITAISYFIIIKGLKSAAILPESFNAWAKNNLWQFIGINAVIWTGISALVITAFRTNIYKLIIIVGTFALAMAFAGNDLVNFIGVPIAALNSYDSWMASGLPASEFSMESLADKVPTQPYLLLLAGIVMVLTLWFSEKARRVVKTSVDLSSQDETEERFRANWLSQNLVRGAIVLNTYFRSLLPAGSKRRITNNFTPLPAAKIKNADTPAFDMVRASINLVVASVLISIATGMKLPLSTTYVTFMVAMGTSLADRAWGSDSAVYRVAGVISVIGGWFMTAITAFVAAAIMAFLLYKFGGYALAGLLTLAVFLIVRSYVKGTKDTKEFKEEIRLQKAQSSSIKGIIEESSGNVSMVMKMGSKLLSNTFKHLAKQDLKALKSDREYSNKLSDEMDSLKSHVFFYIKNLEEDATPASKFYLMIQDSLQDVVQSFHYITKTSYKHVKNNHRGLRYNQIKDLSEIETRLITLFQKIKTEFDNQTLDNLPNIIGEKQDLLDYLSNEIEKQIERTKDPEASAKNTSLYFSIILECKDLVEGITELLEQYYVEHTRTKSADIL